MCTSRDATTDQSSTKNSNFILLSILSNGKLFGPNYMEWMRNLKMTLQYEGKEFVLDKLLIEIDESIVALEEQAAYKQHYDDAKKVACIMVTTMVTELQKFYEDY